MTVYSGCLEDILTKILNTAKTTAETYGLGTDYLAGENIAAFEENVANAMITQGIV
ncbi:glutamate dehydrogenase [Streptococcus gordonii]|nr:glutamate dehydrogenase [Streptococcus gordonii]